MANRPRSHGLFSYYGKEIDLAAAAKEVEQHKGVIWRPIFSLKREDAERLGYDNADRWQELLNANISCLAKNLGIGLADFRWYAAFHDEGDHPHVHLMIYSANPGREFLTEHGIAEIRSTLARQIFKDELVQIYEKQTAARDDVYQKSLEQFQVILSAMRNGITCNQKLDDLLPQIAQALQGHRGKMLYGYLNASTKKLIDAAVDALAEDAKVARAYAVWCDLRREVLHTYRDDVGELPPLSAQPEFKKVRNMVVREVAQAMLGPTDDREQQEEAETTAINEAQPYIDAPADDILTEIQRLNRLARKGNLYANYRLAILYLDQHGDCYDPQKGVASLEKGVQNGHGFSQYRLARVLLSGEVVPKDTTRAIDLLKDSAEQGNQYAQYLLGKLYLFGREVPQNLPLAKQYLSDAALQGNQYAKYLLESQYDRERYQMILSGTRLVQALAQMFEQNQPQPRGYMPRGIDRKRLRQLRERKIALGHAEGDMDIKL